MRNHFEGGVSELELVVRSLAKSIVQNSGPASSSSLLLWPLFPVYWKDFSIRHQNIKPDKNS